ncbi:MAG: LytR/AlgR family response regulator transcription factor [Bacillota bacterium]
MIRVLIVDDESPARKRMRSLIEAEPDLVLVGESADGEDALAKFRELQPDLVFLDIRLPGMSGLELSRLLKSEHSPYVVFTTAHGEYAPEAFRVDAVDYLMKPFDGARLRGEEIVRTEDVVAGFMAKLGGLAQALDATVPFFTPTFTPLRPQASP